MPILRNTGLCYVFFSAVFLKLYSVIKNWIKKKGADMKIEVLGTGCPKCKQLFANVEEAVKESNIQAEIGKVTDIDKITEYGVMMIPALVVDGTVVFAGKVLSKDEIKKFLVK